MVTYLEPDILECEVKWALGSITTSKVSGGDGIPVELFQILKDDAVKVLHSNLENSANLDMPANLKSSAVATGLKRSVFIPIPKKGNAKECSNYCTIAFISHGNPLQCSCLENPMDRGAWWAAVHRVAKSRTQLTRLSSSSTC